MRKVLASFVFFLSMFFGVSDGYANNFAYLIVDGGTGRVIAQHKADELRPPASLVKQMTLYLVFEALHKGKITLQTEFKVSKRATIQEPCNLGLRPGDKITVKNIIYALITRSANDMSVTVAEGLAGSVEDFCVLMNKKAKELGMTKTKFYNPHGLPARGQVTSARDMMTLARSLHGDYPKEYAFFKIKEFRYGGKPVCNHNRMLKSFTGMDGIKTGFTFASRFNISASAQRVGRDGKIIRVFAVVLGGQTSVSRDKKTADLMESAFRKLNAAPGAQQLIDKRGEKDTSVDALDSLTNDIDAAENEEAPAFMEISKPEDQEEAQEDVTTLEAEKSLKDEQDPNLVLTSNVEETATESPSVVKISKSEGFLKKAKSPTLVNTSKVKKPEPATIAKVVKREQPLKSNAEEDKPVIIRLSGKKTKVNTKRGFKKVIDDVATKSNTTQTISARVNRDLPTGWIKGKPVSAD